MSGWRTCKRRLERGSRAVWSAPSLQTDERCLAHGWRVQYRVIQTFSDSKGVKVKSLGSWCNSPEAAWKSYQKRKVKTA